MQLALAGDRRHAQGHLQRHVSPESGPRQLWYLERVPWACFGVRGGYSCLYPDGRFCLCFSAATEKVDFLTPPESDQSRRSSLWVPYVTLLRGFGVFSDPIGLEKELYTNTTPRACTCLVLLEECDSEADIPTGPQSGFLETHELKPNEGAAKLPPRTRR